MSEHHLAFEQTLEVTLGQPVRVRANVFPAEAGFPAHVQLTLDAGPANVTVYPSPLALEELAGNLTRAAAKLRAERSVPA